MPVTMRRAGVLTACLILSGALVLALASDTTLTKEEQELRDDANTLCSGGPPDGFGEQFLECLKSVCPFDLMPSARCVHAPRAKEAEYQDELFEAMCRAMVLTKSWGSPAGTEASIALAKKLQELGDDTEDLRSGHDTVMFWSGDVAKAIAIEESVESGGKAVSLEGTTIFGKFFNNDNDKALRKMVSERIKANQERIKNQGDGSTKTPSSTKTPKATRHYDSLNIWGGLSRAYVELYGPRAGISRKIVVFGESVRNGNVFVNDELPGLVRQQCTLETVEHERAPMDVRFILVDNHTRMNRMIQELLQQYTAKVNPSISLEAKNARGDHSGMEKLKRFLTSWSKELIARDGVIRKCEWEEDGSVIITDVPTDGSSPIEKKEYCMDPGNFQTYLLRVAKTLGQVENSEYWQALNYYSGASQRADGIHYNPVITTKRMISDKISKFGEKVWREEREGDIADCIRNKARNLDEWFHVEVFHVHSGDVNVRSVEDRDVSPFPMPQDFKALGPLSDSDDEGEDRSSCLDINCFQLTTEGDCLVYHGLSGSACCAWHNTKPFCRNKSDVEDVEAAMYAQRASLRSSLRDKQVTSDFDDTPEAENA